MADADWADAAAWAKTNDRSSRAALSTKDLAQLTPLDQYEAISKGFDGNADALYATDVLDQHLTETGRMAFVDWCIKNDSVARADGDASKWAVFEFPCPPVLAIRVPPRAVEDRPRRCAEVV